MKTSAILFPFLLAVVAWSYFTAPPHKHELKPSGPVAESELAPLPLEATYTTAGRIKFEDLTLSFKYPAPGSTANSSPIRSMRPYASYARAAI